MGCFSPLDENMQLSKLRYEISKQFLPFIKFVQIRKPTKQIRKHIYKYAKNLNYIDEVNIKSS